MIPLMNEPEHEQKKPRRGQWISGLLFVLIAAIAVGAIVLQLSFGRH